MSRKPQPPSRVKYAYENPTIGIHVTRQEREFLGTLSQKSGRSVSQLCKQALGILKTDIDSVRTHCLQEGHATGKRVGRAEGRREGYAEAMARYRFAYPCPKCGEQIVILTGSKIADAAVEMLTEAGWGHAQCPQ